MGAAQGRGHVPRGAAQRPLRAVPDRSRRVGQAGLDDPPDGSARRSRTGADARADRADDGPRERRAAQTRARMVVRGQVGRRAGDRLRAARTVASGEPQPQRDHRRLPGGPGPGRPAGDARGCARRGDRRVRRRRAAELRASPAPYARDLAELDPPAGVEHPGGLRDLRPALSRRPFADGAALSRAPRGARGARARRPAWRVPAAPRRPGLAAAGGDQAQGLEGVIAKRLDSRYEPGSATAPG